MNVLTIKKRNCLSARKRHIYVKWNIRNVWHVLERCQRSQRVERSHRYWTFAQTAKLKFWQTFRGKPFLIKTGIVTSSPLCRFSDFFRAGYIISVLRHFFCFPEPSIFWPWSANNIKTVFLLPVLSLKKGFLRCFLVLAVKQSTPIILKNRASSHQTIMFIHVVCFLIGPVIYSLFVNNDCVRDFFCFWLF